MKRIMGVILAVFMIFAGCIEINADEVVATFAYMGASSVTAGEEFSLDVVIKDVKEDAITGAIALIDYDKEYLEFVSIKASANSPLAIFTNLNTVKFAGLSLTGEGIKEDTALLTITFKPIKEGNTTLGFSELDLCNTKAKTVSGKMEEFNITIKAEEKPVELSKTAEMIVAENTMPNITLAKVNETIVKKQEEIISVVAKLSKAKIVNAINNAIKNIAFIK